MKLLEACWGLAIGLHCLLITNYILQRIASRFTDYYLPLDEILKDFLTFTIGFSILTIFATLIARFGHFRRKKSTR